MTIGWHFDNTYSKLSSTFKEDIKPTPVHDPELVILNEKLAEEHPYNGADLHLMMQDEPCDYSNGNSFSGGAPPLKSN